MRSHRVELPCMVGVLAGTEKGAIMQARGAAPRLVLLKAVGDDGVSLLGTALGKGDEGGRCVSDTDAVVNEKRSAAGDLQGGERRVSVGGWHRRLLSLYFLLLDLLTRLTNRNII